MFIVSKQLLDHWFELMPPCDVFQPDVYVISDTHIEELRNMLSQHLERKQQ
jgi:hypothetical protein